MSNKSSSFSVDCQAMTKYFADKCVLDHVNLSVGCGERLVICGPSGSGKSTFIRTINGLEGFESGKLEVLGELITEETNWHLLRPRVGMLFQQFNLFPHMTILENCTLAPKMVKKISEREAIEIAYHFLEKVHIADQAEKYPIALSGGQQQRAAIARCLSMQPELILFDEPTSALDPEMIQEVLDVMLTLVDSGITMLCVTHEMSFARKFADRIIFIDTGQILEQASPEEFFAHTKTERAKQFLSQIDVK